MQSSEQPASEPTGSAPAGKPAFTSVTKIYNGWSGFTFLQKQGIDKSSVAPLRGVAATVFLGLTGLQVLDAFVSPEPLKSAGGAVGSLVIGSACMWGMSAIEVGCAKLKQGVVGKPKPPSA